MNEGWWLETLPILIFYTVGFKIVMWCNYVIIESGEIKMRVERKGMNCILDI